MKGKITWKRLQMRKANKKLANMLLTKYATRRYREAGKNYLETRLRPRYFSIGLPDKFTTRLRYVDQIQLDANASTISAYVYRANDLYDPDVTGTGHQPNPFDQMMQFYRTACVIGSRIKVTANILSTTQDSTPCPYVCILKSATGTEAVSLSGPTDVMEQTTRSSAVKQFGNYITKSLSSNNYITANFSAKKWFRSNNIVGSREYSCDTSSSPTEVCYYEIAYFPYSTENPAVVLFTIEIDYLAVFTENKIVAQS